MRPRLTPAIADVRRAVRGALAAVDGGPSRGGSATATSTIAATDVASLPASAPLALVALSGGADSLALAAGAAFEGPRAGWRIGAIVVDHGLQEDSARQAERAASQARELGLAPVLVERVSVAPGDPAGPEAAARNARYQAFDRALEASGAEFVLVAHTLDDQAETVQLGLARGSGAASLQGMALVTGRVLRPLLGIRRATTRQSCLDLGLTPWDDPHNLDPSYARVRVRQRILPVLEEELGPGVAEALARTAEQLREDASALDAMADEVAEDLAEHAEAGISLPVAALEANPPALRHRLIRLVVSAEFGRSLTRQQTLEVARLVTDWHGQGPIDLPGCTASRVDGRIVFSARG